ncbi:MAG: isoleucine--tRNA ligase [Anaerolineales bacterium]|jgi:isoleucyl-tRNA synthetase
MFDPVTSHFDPQRLEAEVLRFWRERDVFRRSMDIRRGGPDFVFFEGPPTANGKPGVHHVLARAFKDLFPRYRTMRGFYVRRRGGWDTHGLPVEIAVEKELQFHTKQDIEAYGIDKFNEHCRASVFRYIQDWERLTERIAFWVDLDDAYVTYTRDYIESVWWILKSFWDRGLLYQGFKVVPYCPRCGTPLSDHELHYPDALRETEDPSVYVRFPLRDDPQTSFLAWTTTPWTLPANVALAVHPDTLYARVERTTSAGEREYLIVAKDLVETVLADEPHRVVGDYLGKELEGWRYQPLFTFLPLEKPAHRVVLGSFVTTTEGTGVVHQAPAFGADDMQMALEHDLPVLMTVDPSGRFVPEVRPWQGMFVKEADPLITKDLAERGLLFRGGKIVHTYPFCWRCGTPLLYYARSTWYIRTTQFLDRLVALNETIHWHPDHIRRGRFGNWLANNVDWALGRERYWGTPLPIWECNGCHYQECVGSVADLSQRTGKDLSDLDLHRPYVDQVTWSCPKCQQEMKRVPELIDVWFDSGAMPVAQWHYPFENAEIFQHQFPADFICEAVDQTRGWFYSLHAISTLLKDSVAFKNVIVLGLVLDAAGQKMSKSRGNVVDPWEVLNSHGADAFRWYLYTASPPGQERRFSTDLVGEVIRSFTLTLWNVFSFFVTYANLDGWVPDEALNRQASLGHPAGGRAGRAYSDLDRWILSELHVLVRSVSTALENYDALGATRPIEAFVDRLSNWYLRRSRRRFWKSGQDAEKNAAYATLYECLTTLAKLLAPSMPFLAEAIYRNLVSARNERAPESVHLADWPEYDRAMVDEMLNAEMGRVLRWASLGHAARSHANLKVRQPLAEIAFSVASREEAATLEKYRDLLADELNVKRARKLDTAEDVLTYSLHPRPQLLGPKHGALFPRIRAALSQRDAGAAAVEFLQGRSLSIEVEGESIQILPEEVEVRMTAREGYSMAEEGGNIAALSTGLTPELIGEGLAREFVRRVQDLRKNAGLEIADRIQIFYKASPKLAQAVEHHRQYIAGETLALSLESGEAPPAASRAEHEFDGESLLVGIVRAGAPET